MAVFPVIITNTPPASVTITMANYTYDQFVKSLGSYFYLVEKMYLYSTNANQVNQVMLFTKYDSNGNQYYNNLTPQINPYQKSNAVLFATKDNNLVLDSLSTLNLNVLANNTLVLEIYANRRDIPNYLNNLAISNFAQVESAMGTKDLFENYTDKI